MLQQRHQPGEVLRLIDARRRDVPPIGGGRSDPGDLGGLIDLVQRPILASEQVVGQALNVARLLLFALDQRLQRGFLVSALYDVEVCARGD